MRAAGALIRGFCSAAAAPRHTSSSSSALLLRSRPVFFRRVSMATQSQSSSQQSQDDDNNYNSSSSSPEREREIERRPWLMISAPTRPGLRYLYDIADGCFHHTLHLPSIGAGRLCIGSSQGFIISIDKVTRDILAVNPLTGAHLSFPSAADVPPGFLPLQPDDRGKAILSPSLDVMVALCGDGLVFAAAGDSSWTRLPARLHMYDDCIFHEGLLHSINYCGEMEIHDLNRPNTPPFVLQPGPILSDANYSKFLVESPEGGSLFIVSRGERCDPDWSPPAVIDHRAFDTRLDGDDIKLTLYYETLATFQVFQLNKDDHSWHDVKSLDEGSLAVFVGTNHSFAVRASDFSNIKANSIYFTRKPVMDSYLGRDEDMDMQCFVGVFELGERCFNFHQFQNRFKKFYYPPPIWFMPSKTSP